MELNYIETRNGEPTFSPRLSFSPSSGEWTNPKASGSGRATTIMRGKCSVGKFPSKPDFDLDHHQNLMTCFFYHPGHLKKISLQSIDNILSNAANKVNKPTDDTENINLLVGDNNHENTQTGQGLKTKCAGKLSLRCVCYCAMSSYLVSCTPGDLVYCCTVG